jgi:hypothetical protein
MNTVIDIKSLIDSVEPDLASQPFIIVHSFERAGRRLNVGLTSRLRRACQHGRVWKTPEFLDALASARHGFDGARVLPAEDRDGIFLITRSRYPRNEMMRKIYDQFLDRQGSEAAEIAHGLGARVDSLLPVRVTGDRLRLLGVMVRGDVEDTLVLVDYDDSSL